MCAGNRAAPTAPWRGTHPYSVSRTAKVNSDVTHFIALVVTSVLVFVVYVGCATSLLTGQFRLGDRSGHVAALGAVPGGRNSTQHASDVGRSSRKMQLAITVGARQLAAPELQSKQSIVQQQWADFRESGLVEGKCMSAVVGCFTVHAHMAAHKPHNTLLASVCAHRQADMRHVWCCFSRQVISPQVNESLEALLRVAQLRRDWSCSRLSLMLAICVHNTGC